MVVGIDISGLGYLLPVFSFLLVFSAVFALLFKTEVFGENKYGQLFVSFLVATVFVLAVRPQEFVLMVVPWFAIIVLCLVFILALTGFMGKGGDSLGRGFGKAAAWVLLGLFVVAALFAVAPYLPGGAYTSDTNSEAFNFFQWFYSSRIFGAVLIIAASAIASWFLVRAND